MLVRVRGRTGLLPGLRRLRWRTLGGHFLLHVLGPFQGHQGHGLFVHGHAQFLAVRGHAVHEGGAAFFREQPGLNLLLEFVKTDCGDVGGFLPALKQLLGSYTDKITPKSIDEFVLDLEGAPAFRLGMRELGREIKRRIREEIGDWLTVSVGIGPNRFLAKTAAGLKKPDGLEQIDNTNYLQVYTGLALTDLAGIKLNNTVRLNNLGIFTVMDFYLADIPVLKAAFASVLGYYWYLRLHGFEVDDAVFARKSYGNSFSLPRPFSSLEELSPILQKLVEKMGFRMRRAGYRARGVHVGVLYRDWGHWHRGHVQPEVVFDSRDIYKAALRILSGSPYRKPVHTLAVSCFDLVAGAHLQTTLLDDIAKKDNLVRVLDAVNERWGNFVITPAHMLAIPGRYVPDRVAFGGIKELEEIVLGSG